jgi:hypothetical protein
MLCCVNQHQYLKCVDNTHSVTITVFLNWRFQSHTLLQHQKSLCQN